MTPPSKHVLTAALNLGYLAMRKTRSSNPAYLKKYDLRKQSHEVVERAWSGPHPLSVSLGSGEACGHDR